MRASKVVKYLKYVKAAGELFEGNPFMILLDAYRHGEVKVKVKATGEVLNLTTSELITVLHYYTVTHKAPIKYPQGGLGFSEGLLTAHGIVFDDDYVYIDGFKFIRRINGKPVVDSAFIETFIDEAYAPVGFTYRGATVLDVGAYIGDSAFYMIKQGASMVYAVEPIDEFYEALRINIRVNNLEDKVKAIHARIGELTKWPPILANTITSTAPAVSLSELSRLAKASVLKMDCEGCEWWVLNNEPEAFLNFNVVVTEVHYDVKRFIKKMKGLGFRVTAVKRTSISPLPTFTLIKAE